MQKQKLITLLAIVSFAFFSKVQAADYTYTNCIDDGGSEAYCGQFSGAPASSTNLSNMSDGNCNKDGDCGSGFECYQGTCVDNSTYSGNTSWGTRLWESTKETVTGDWDQWGSGTGSSSSTRTNSGSNGSTNLGSNTIYSGNTGSVSAGCQNGYEKVGGVCFPTKAQTGLSDASISQIIASIFTWLTGIFVTLALIAFVFSGIQYLSAAGDADLAKSAKQNAQWAAIGVLVGFSGYIIIKAIANMLAANSFF
jgi:hypothetical protein